MMNTYRVYTDVKKINEDYYEATYKEYRGTQQIGYGKEDFSKARLQAATKKFDVFGYNGRVMHGVYREGYKMTDWCGTLRTSKNACKIQVARMIYGENVARVS